MILEQSNISKGKSALEGLVLYLSQTVTTQKKFGLSSVGFLYKKIDNFI